MTDRSLLETAVQQLGILQAEIPRALAGVSEHLTALTTAVEALTHDVERLSDASRNIFEDLQRIHAMHRELASSLQLVGTRLSALEAGGVFVCQNAHRQDA